jgi:pantoate--beta-alanine ligase
MGPKSVPPEPAPLVVISRAGLSEVVDRWRREGARIGLVPTMGALHAGHLALIRRARGECDRVVVSIFVNPLQFAPTEDLARYPRPLERDLGLLALEGVDAAYTPPEAEMYPRDATTRVRVEVLDELLEGAHRPGHFTGVATVVAKLLNAAHPHAAYFGQKDAQQAAVIKRMARDLDTGVEIVVVPIVREPDGLALSSRNVYLSEPERAAATCLFRALGAANAAFIAGERDPRQLRGAMCEVLEAEPLALIDYAEVVNPETLAAPGRLAVLAVRIGATRLIDNHLLGEPLALA